MEPAERSAIKQESNEERTTRNPQSSTGNLNRRPITAILHTPLSSLLSGGNNLFPFPTTPDASLSGPLYMQGRLSPNNRVLHQIERQIDLGNQFAVLKNNELNTLLAQSKTVQEELAQKTSEFVTKYCGTPLQICYLSDKPDQIRSFFKNLSKLSLLKNDERLWKGLLPFSFFMGDLPIAQWLSEKKTQIDLLQFLLFLPQFNTSDLSEGDHPALLSKPKKNVYFLRKSLPLWTISRMSNSFLQLQEVCVDPLPYLKGTKTIPPVFGLNAKQLFLAAMLHAIYEKNGTCLHELLNLKEKSDLSDDDKTLLLSFSCFSDPELEQALFSTLLEHLAPLPLNFLCLVLVSTGSKKLIDAVCQRFPKDQSVSILVDSSLWTHPLWNFGDTPPSTCWEKMKSLGIQLRWQNNPEGIRKLIEAKDLPLLTIALQEQGISGNIVDQKGKSLLYSFNPEKKQLTQNEKDILKLFCQQGFSPDEDFFTAKRECNEMVKLLRQLTLNPSDRMLRKRKKEEDT